MSTILDNVYMVVLPEAQGICYSAPATSSRQAWENWIEKIDEPMHSPESMTRRINHFRKMGFRAKKVRIELVS